MFSKKQKNELITLVVDVGSSSVGAALVSASKEAQAKVVYSTRLSCPVPDSAGADRNYYITAVSQTLEQVMKTVLDQHHPIHGYHIIFSSPWYSSQTNVTRIDHNSPALISRHAVEKLVDESEQKFISESGANSEVVEHRVIRTKINGYETADPYNKKTKSAELTFYVSLIAKDILEAVRRIIEKNFHSRNSEISSFSLAAFSALASIVPEEKDLLIIDVRGEVTDISVVIDAALMKTSSFPQSKNGLIRTIASGLGQSPEAALSMIDLAYRGSGDATAEANVAKFAEAFKQEWLQEYNKTIQDLSTAFALPQRIFILADDDVDMFFERVLSETRNYGNLLTLKHLDLQKIIDPASVPTDPFLALESIFVTIV